MLSDVSAALAQSLSPPFRSILWKSLLFTLILLAGFGWAADRLVLTGLASSPAWVRLPASILTGVGFVVCAAYLLAPISAMVAGFYADEMAGLVEMEIDRGRAGRPVRFGQGLWLGVRFAGLGLVVNAIALALLLVPIVNVVAFLGANAYLLGRMSFELAALRHRPPREAVDFYRRHAARVFLSGLSIALLLSVPVLNLITPLFGVALMTRLYLRLEGLETPRTENLLQGL